MRHALPQGTRILAADGEIPVEALSPGSRVVTRDRGMVEIRAVHRAPVPAGQEMILVPVGAMGRGRPGCDLLLVPDQPVVLRGWRAQTLFRAREARVAIGRIADGTVIRHVHGPAMLAVSLVLDGPSALYAEGLEVVSASIDAI
ncbi:Hint domain-containing protein [Jannaschia aquimarina]|nr:Hint domain-containing protein [Jannaschia aquimarina]